MFQCYITCPYSKGWSRIDLAVEHVHLPGHCRRKRRQNWNTLEILGKTPFISPKTRKKSLIHSPITNKTFVSNSRRTERTFINARPTHPRFGRVPQTPQHEHSRRITDKRDITNIKGINMQLPAGPTTVLSSELALITFNHGASGQHSCVQTVDATFSTCICYAAELSLSIIRETWVVNVVSRSQVLCSETAAAITRLSLRLQHRSSLQQTTGG